MKRRVCLIAGPYDVTLSVSNGLAAWSRTHQPFTVQVLPAAGDHSISWLNRASFAAAVAVSPEPDIVHQLQDTGLPWLCVHSDIPEVPTVNVDDEAVGRMAAEHLIECGYRQLAYYGVRADWSIVRHAAFAAHARARGRKVRTNQIDGEWSGWDSVQREGDLEAFLTALPSNTAVMACNDVMARMLCDACGDLKLRVPEDVAILGVDNCEALCESDQVTLSSVDTDYERFGREAGRLLDHAIRAGKPLNRFLELIAPRCVVRRRSTNPAAFDDPDIAAAVTYIRESACDGVTVDDVCRKLAISRRQLERRFLKSVGELPGAMLRHLRISRARQLLEETDLPLTDIAMRCGYEHLSSFSAAFRDTTGQSPSEFRRS